MGPSFADHSAPPGPPMRAVVFIAGLPRSGSTLCGRLLASYFDVQFCGELLHLDALCQPRELCGCGTSIEDCSYWRPVIELLGDEDSTSLRCAIRQSIEDPGAKSVARVEALLRSVIDVLYCNNQLPIVDSSKVPALARRHLAGSHGTNLHVLHLVRDPSAVIASISTRPLRRPEIPDAEARLRTFPASQVADRWRRHNAEAAQLRHFAKSYHLVRLEELALDPSGILQEIATHIGLCQRPSRPAIDHSLRGNPARFEPLHVDPIRVRRSGWVRHSAMLRVRALARARYGYSLI